jgi:TetR/AcrR family transcriptional repressor of nem operon
MSVKRDGRTADRILDVAEHLVQVRGFNAFSYADVSKALGIRKASLHHHFATKTDLGAALVRRYRLAFLDSLRDIESGGDDAVERLERYADLYRSVLSKQRMCMCGMLAADIATLPAVLRESVAEFFSENEAWLTRILRDGRKRGELRFTGSPASMAAFFVSTLEGAMLLARGSGALARLDEAARHLLASVRPPVTKAPRRAKRGARTAGSGRLP